MNIQRTAFIDFSYLKHASVVLLHRPKRWSYDLYRTYLCAMVRIDRIRY